MSVIRLTMTNGQTLDVDSDRHGNARELAGEGQDGWLWATVQTEFRPRRGRGNPRAVLIARRNICTMEDIE